MASEPLTNEAAVAITDMKMEMTLDEIIKLSKKDKPNRKNARRSSNKTQKKLKDSARHPNFSKVQNFLESRSFIRQGVLAKRRTNFQRNQFQVTTEFARNTAPPPRNWGAGNWNKTRKPSFQIKAAERDGNASGKNKFVPQQRQTLDARFAIMAVQRKHALPPQRLPLRVGSWDRNEQLHQSSGARVTSGFRVGFARRSANFRR